ncbi:MAG: hypothetical protein ABIY40_07175 [Rhodanobacteraceae bacterium]
MDIRQKSRAALQSSADALESAATQIKRSAGWVADNAGDVADDAWQGINRAGREVGSFARNRPAETAVILLVVGWVLGTLFTRRSRDD